MSNQQFYMASEDVADIEHAVESEEFHLGIRRLRELVASSQNVPPHGGADGSIDNELWIALRSVVLRTEALECGLKQAREMIEARARP